MMKNRFIILLYFSARPIYLSNKIHSLYLYIIVLYTGENYFYQILENKSCKFWNKNYSSSHIRAEFITIIFYFAPKIHPKRNEITNEK